MPTRKGKERASLDRRPKQVAAANRSKCKYCHAEVWWFKRPDGRTHPPVVPFGTVLTIVYDEDGLGTVTEANGVIRHQCDPDAVDQVNALNAAQAAQAEAKIAAAREAIVTRKSAQTMAEEAYRTALPYECPACAAEANQRCLNLNRLSGRKGSESQPVHTKWPHPDRVLVAENHGRG